MDILHLPYLPPELWNLIYKTEWTMNIAKVNDEFINRVFFITIDKRKSIFYIVEKRNYYQDLEVDICIF